jgi:hypothetical protein
MAITHTLVSAVVDDGVAGEVGPDEWNDDHVVDISFLDLNDVPASYTGEAGKVLKVNVTENALVFATEGGVVDFVDLGDVPATYTGEGGKFVAVKSDETGLEFVDEPAAGAGTGKFDVRVPPASPNAMDDEFNDESGMSGPVNGLDAQWTHRNQSTTTYTFPQVGRLKITPPTSAVASWRIIEQAVAAGDFAFEMKVSLNSRQANFASVGMVAIDRTNGDFYTIALGTAAVATANPPQQILQQAWNSVTSFGSQVTARNYGPNSVYLKIERLSTALWFWYSSDGESWVNVTAALADAVSVNGIGIGISHEHNLAGTFATVEYFRRTL